MLYSLHVLQKLDFQCCMTLEITGSLLWCHNLKVDILRLVLVTLAISAGILHGIFGEFNGNNLKRVYMCS